MMYSSEHPATLDWYQYLIYSGVAFFCVCFAGLMSGLTLGLLSIEKMTLKIIMQVGTPKEQKYSTRLYPILRHRHWLLVTLLLWNAAAMESLPIFLDMMVPEYIAIILSVTFVLIFGEVVPQSIISRFGLQFGGNLYWLVWILMVASSPISWPMGKLLDFILGADHSAVYKRAELRELMNYHVKGGEDGGDLNVDEVNVIKGALLLSEKKIANIITPIEDVFMLSVDDVLNQETIEKLLSYGHSRVPVYQESRKNIIGLILVKRLLNINTALSTPVKDIKMSEVVYVEAKASIWSVLTLFQSGKSHMAVVKSEQSEDDVMEEVNNIGIVTLEDIFEELIQKDIEDETDLIVKPQRKTLTEVLRKVTEPLRNKFKSPSAPNQIEIEMDTVLMNDIGTTLRSDTAGGHL